VDTAASWTTNFFQEQNVDVAAKLSNTPKMYIAETGWPTVRTNLSRLGYYMLIRLFFVHSNRPMLETLITEHLPLA
jgi:hypothetical protein